MASAKKFKHIYMSVIDRRIPKSDQNAEMRFFKHLLVSFRHPQSNRVTKANKFNRFFFFTNNNQHRIIFTDI